MTAAVKNYDRAVVEELRVRQQMMSAINTLIKEAQKRKTQHGLRSERGSHIITVNKFVDQQQKFRL